MSRARFTRIQAAIDRKLELQKLADELGIDITVHHLPPGTSSRVDDWRGGVRPRG